MELVKEFLESSTIHGLSYISTSKVGAYIKSVRESESVLFDFNAFCSLIMFRSATVLEFQPPICAIIIHVLFRQDLKSVFGLSLSVLDSLALGFSSADPFWIGKRAQYPHQLQPGLLRSWNFPKSPSAQRRDPILLSTLTS